MKHSRIALIIIGVLLTAQAATPRPCIGQECTGRYKGKAPSSAELQEILKQHGVWVKVFPYAQYHLDDPKVANDPRRANLCGANLASAGLNRASLAGANLDGANLSQANLDGANFSQANLDGAYLDFANLSGAYLDGAHLIGADLSRANLTYADLSQANLTYANLTGANLIGAEVSKAKLAYTTLTNSLYAPASEPPYLYVAGIKGLATIKCAPGEQIGLIQLRKLLQDAGLSDDAREATFAIQRNITRDQLSRQFLSSVWINGHVRIIGFEWTTQYGLHPARALLWILLLGMLVMPVYMFAILCPTAENGIIKEEKLKEQIIRAQGLRDAFPVAAYFSFISAFNIGFAQFTPGDWIRRLQRREYSLEAVGWVRVVADLQTLTSLYMLAMWVLTLTQFGQLFG